MTFKEEIKVSDFPKFNRTAKTFNAWLEKGDIYYAAYGYDHPLLIDALAHVATTNFEGCFVVEWPPHELRADYTRDWPTLYQMTQDHIMHLTILHFIQSFVLFLVLHHTAILSNLCTVLSDYFMLGHAQL